MHSFFLKSLLAGMIGISLFLACNQHSDTSISNEIDQKVANNNYLPQTDLGSQVVSYASTLLGTPYKEAGKDTLGFDCSGFVSFVFKKYNIKVPSSSRHIAQLGEEIQIEEAKPGDLVFFKGTDPNSTAVGHIGIVVSQPGKPIEFIHSSSAKASAYVKYDSLARPNYKRRFIMVKRIL